MTVAVDATSSASAHGTGTSGTIATLTVGSGSNRGLVAIMVNDVNPGTVTAIWDSGGTNQAMGQIGTTEIDSVGGAVSVFGLVAPTSGTKTLAFTTTNTVSDIYMDLMSFTGVDQTGGSTSFPNVTQTQGGLGTPSVTITSAIGNYTFSGISSFDNLSSNNQTLLHYDHSGNVVIEASQYAAGAATVTHSFTLAGSNGTAIIGFDIKAASGGAAANPTFPWWELANQASIVAQ
jgi:hypothetical protein